ncbi:MAG: hypothetical protein DIJKHBIC_00598 [Thermoanaerobaculia bacterium]|nr:hypothetical protein [Thermoanaerobaculia bacterium]
MEAQTVSMKDRWVARIVFVALIAATLLLFGRAVKMARADGRRASPREDLEKLARLSHSLSAFPVGVEGDASTDVPARAIPLISETKAGVRGLVTKTIALSPHLTSRPELLQALIETQLQSVGLWPFGEQARHYGELQGLSAGLVPGNPDFLAVTLDLAIECGRDTSLLLFEKRHQGWTLSLVVSNDGYTRISEAIEGLEYAISPPRPDGTRFVVTTNWTPWCSSNWSGLNTRVFIPGPDPLSPRVILDREDFVFGAYDHENGLVATASGFRLSCTVAQSLDAELHSRERLLTYRIDGTEVTRVPPFAADPRGFLDEWLAFPWTESEKWTLPEAAQAAQEFHRDLSERRDRVFTSFGECLKCTGERERWLLELRIEGREDASEPSGGTASVFVDVGLRDGSYRLEGVATTRPRDCPGKPLDP